MTTRAGTAGILTGMVTTMIIYPLSAVWLDARLHGGSTSALLYAWIAVVVASILAIGGGWLASRWSGSVHPGRCAALGGLAGGLAGVIVFCWWGAAAAGLARPLSLLDQATNEAIRQPAPIETISAIIRQTLGTFLALLIGGSGLGASGGRLACPHRSTRTDMFDKGGPQMALNASITAVIASIITAALAAAFFSRLANFVGGQTVETASTRIVVDMPLTVCLLLVLISQLALTLVVPFEARRVEHLCGMDEVKMAAYVGIGASPTLILLLLLIEAASFSNPLVVAAILVSIGLSLLSLHALFRLILPRRASFPAPQEGRQKTEAQWFGTITTSNGPRLVVLCIGCGLVMGLPVYVSVLSVLINLTHAPASLAFAQPIPETVGRLFRLQALASSGVVAVSIAVLTAIYLFYLGLGRWLFKPKDTNIQPE